MNSRPVEEWQQANQRYLAACLQILKERLESHASRGPSPAHEEPDERERYLDWHLSGAPPALESLCSAFSLSLFERELLLLCAGVEVQPEIAALCAAANDDPRKHQPTFARAMQALKQPHWSAITPSSPLRRWHLIRIGSGDLLTKSPLQIDERVLHFLMGVQSLDERLQGFVEPVVSSSRIPPSYEAIADRIVDLQMKSMGSGEALIQLCGVQEDGKRAIALYACRKMGLALYALRAGDIPAAVAEREALARLWEREAFFSSSALLVDCEQVLGKEGSPSISAAVSFLQSVHSFAMTASREPLACPGRLSIRLDVEKPTSDEQEGLWRAALNEEAGRLDGHLGQVISQFDLGLSGIERAGAQVLSALSSDRSFDLSTDLSSERDEGSASCRMDSLLWEACRRESRPRLSELAIRIDPRAEWDDLVLPQPQKKILREVAAQVRQRSRVYRDWGFAAKGARGLGISALFTGGSGTGKTMAAEVLAGELELDLYRIDLSQVVSKYIGETEKNIRQVFDAADEGGAILLFDEADALFGKRSEVKDSHDRYANIEISYLLQRMEEYRGLAILTTNMKKALDTAFMRRIRFIIDFPFPDAAGRAEIWSRIFPKETPLADLDISRLARLNVAGGSIRNIALYAAFLAAEAGESVGMLHLLRAAQVEYGKLDRPLAESEVGGWA